jgi:hypothetical protein
MSAPVTLRVEPWQREAMALPISWLGDLDDDCTAEWAGLTLRAEYMDRKHWWWAVYDSATSEIITDSHASSEVARSGKHARSAAERAARSWLSDPQPSNTWSARVKDKVPSPNRRSRGAQLNR